MSGSETIPSETTPSETALRGTKIWIVDFVTLIQDTLEKKARGETIDPETNDRASIQFNKLRQYHMLVPHPDCCIHAEDEQKENLKLIFQTLQRAAFSGVNIFTPSGTMNTVELADAIQDFNGFCLFFLIRELPSRSIWGDAAETKGIHYTKAFQALFPSPSGRYFKAERQKLAKLLMYLFHFFITKSSLPKDSVNYDSALMVLDLVLGRKPLESFKASSLPDFPDSPFKTFLSGMIDTLEELNTSCPSLKKTPGLSTADYEGLLAQIESLQKEAAAGRELNSALQRDIVELQSFLHERHNVIQQMAAELNVLNAQIVQQSKILEKQAIAIAEGNARELFASEKTPPAPEKKSTGERKKTKGSAVKTGSGSGAAAGSSAPPAEKTDEKLKQAQEDIARLKAQLAEQEKAISQCATRIIKRENELRSALQDLSQNKQALSDRNKKIDDQTEQIRRLEAKLDKLKSELAIKSPTKIDGESQTAETPFETGAGASAEQVALDRQIQALNRHIEALEASLLRKDELLLSHHDNFHRERTQKEAALQQNSTLSGIAHAHAGRIKILEAEVSQAFQSGILEGRAQGQAAVLRTIPRQLQEAFRAGHEQGRIIGAGIVALRQEGPPAAPATATSSPRTALVLASDLEMTTATLSLAAHL